MAHVSELLWQSASRIAEIVTSKSLDSILDGEAAYQRLLVMVDGRSDQIVSDQLFNGTATAAQVAMFVDLKNAMISIHNIWQTASNIAVSTSDRMTDMRKMASRV